jgi:alkylation response protein AidB-like acyl-CoA dehydrogenase
VSLDLDWDDAQQAVQSAVAQLGRDRWDDDAVKAMVEGAAFPEAPWQELAELGLLGVMTPEGDGGAREAVAALEVVGRFGLPGPLVDTLVAGQLFEGSQRAALAAGETVAVIGTTTLWPWPERADVLLVARGGCLHRASASGATRSVSTLGGEPWGRGTLEAGEPYAESAHAQAVGETALSALLVGAGTELVARAAEHTRTRSQFGRVLGEFQAVAHPLADAHMGLEAARTLAHRAACALDDGEDRAAARRASLAAVFVVHQVFGAQGITLEGPVYHLSRRIRQWASHPLPTAPDAVLDWMLGAARAEEGA